MKKRFLIPLSILVISLFVITSILLYACKHKELTKSTESATFNSDPKATRLYKEAIDSALTEKIDGHASGIAFRIYLPKGYSASSTKETIYLYKEYGDLDITRIYKTNPDYQEEFIEIFTIPYSEQNKDELVKTETKRHTFQYGEPTYKRESYEELSYRDGLNVNKLYSKASYGGEGGESGDEYFVYFLLPEKYNRVLVVRTAVETSIENLPAIMQSKTYLFFKIVNEMEVW